MSKGIAHEFIVGPGAPSAEEALNGTPIPLKDFGTLTLQVAANSDPRGYTAVHLGDYVGTLRVTDVPAALGTAVVGVSGTYAGPGSRLSLTS